MPYLFTHLSGFLSASAGEQRVRLVSMVLGVVVTSCLCPVSPTRAQAPEEARSDEEARLLFEAGARAFNDGRFEVALARFREAYDLSHEPALLYNIGQAADRVRMDREALEAFERYLVEMPDAENRREVEGRVAALRRILGASTSPAGDAAEDSAPADQDELATTTAIGADGSSVAMPGAADDHGPDDGSAGPDTLHSVPAADEVSDSETGGSVLGPLGWTSLGLGVAGLGVSAAALALRNTEAEAFNGPGCLEPGRTRSEVCGGRYDAAVTWESVAIGTLIGGGVLVTTGAVLLGVDTASSGSEEAGSARVACAPAVGTSWGLTCRGVF